MVLMGWELRPLNSRTLNTSREGGDVMRRNFLRMGSLVPQVLLMGLGLVLVVLQGPASAMISPAKPSTAQAQAQAQGQSPPHPKEDWWRIHRELIASFKTGDADLALSLYDEAKAKGYQEKRYITKNVYNAVMNLCANSDRVATGMQVLADMGDAGHTPQENSYSFLIREKAARGAGTEAFELIKSMVEKHGISPRLRSYSPILHAVLKQGDMATAWNLWDHMKSYNVLPSAEIYAGMLVCLGRLGALANPSWQSSRVMELLEGLNAQALMVPSSLSEGLISALNFGRHERPVATQVLIGEDGVCPQSGVKLHAVGLSSSDKAGLRVALGMLAGDGSSTGKKAVDDFCGWLERRQRDEGVIYTVVIDAPNIAYSDQNFPGGCYQVSQLQAAVEELESKGENVLVVWPERYMNKLIPNSTRFASLTRRRTALSDECLALMADWESRGMLYRAPDGANDDWLWMVATVAYDNLPVLVVSNDLMRDHRLALLPEVPFLRWKRTQIIHYRFTRPGYEGLQCKPVIELRPPPPFTRDVQKCRQKNVWHLPIETQSEIVQESIIPQTEANDAEVFEGGESQLADAVQLPWICLDLDSITG